MTVSFRVKLLITHAIVALAVSAVTLAVVERSVSQRMESQIDKRLEAQAAAVARWLERAGHPDRLAGRLAAVVGARVTILSSEGVLEGDSGADSDAELLRGNEPPEIIAVRDGHVGRHTRVSGDAGEQVRYVAVPAPNGSVVRLGLAIGEIDDTKSELRKQIGFGALASLLVALALAALIAGPLSRRLRRVTAIAQRIGVGDYDVQPPSEDKGDEVGVLARTLTNAATELRETEARRREFLATVAHEIRTPVTSIRGFAQTLIETDVDEKHRQEFANTIHRNAVRISKLVEDLLELEALQAGHSSTLARDAVPLAPVVDNVISTLRTQIEDRGAGVEQSISSDLIIRGDADGIERIILNLMSNALRYGGEGVEVSVTASRAGDLIKVSVGDNGPGIAEEHRKRVFERFQRGGAQPSSSRGTGLGLAIARELARTMGGSLVLEESPQGALFTVTIPVA